MTQTVTYELVPPGENEARLRLYVAVAALSQAFDHPELPADANARRMTVETRAERSLRGGEDEKELSVVRKLHFESERSVVLTA